MKQKILIFRTEVRETEVEIDVQEGMDVLAQIKEIEGNVDFHWCKLVDTSYSYGNLPVPENIAKLAPALLDEAVNDTALENVTANNGGIQEQYDFLRSNGWSDEEIRENAGEIV